MVMPRSGPCLCFLSSFALKMVCFGCLEVWQARRKLYWVWTWLRYCSESVGVSSDGARNVWILSASGEEMWGYAGRVGCLGKKLV